MCLESRTPYSTDFWLLELQFGLLQFNKHLLSSVPWMYVEWENISTNGILAGEPGELSPSSFVLGTVGWSDSERKLWSQTGMGSRLSSVT